VLLAEIGDTYWFNPHQPLSSPMTQTLFKGKHRSSEPDLVADFQEALDTGNRSFKFGGLDILVMLCGEQNILEVPNTFQPMFPDTFRWLWDYNLLVNPTHDSMGQWNRVAPRLQLLSRDNRVVIHTANNLRKSSWGTAIRVYRNGELLLDGNFDNRDDLDKQIEDHWRLVTIEV
jgi:hypothetical protein